MAMGRGPNPAVFKKKNGGENEATWPMLAPGEKRRRAVHSMGKRKLLFPTVKRRKNDASWDGGDGGKGGTGFRVKSEREYEEIKLGRKKQGFHGAWGV